MPPANTTTSGSIHASSLNLQNSNEASVRPASSISLTNNIYNTHSLPLDLRENDDEKSRQIKLNLQLPPVKHRPNAKHVSRACLQCRARHLRCDGNLPICGRCSKSDKTCTYVKSHRGGSRRRKRQKNNNISTHDTNDNASDDIAVAINGNLIEAKEMSITPLESNTEIDFNKFSKNLSFDQMLKMPCVTGATNEPCPTSNCPLEIHKRLLKHPLSSSNSFSAKSENSNENSNKNSNENSNDNFNETFNETFNGNFNHDSENLLKIDILLSSIYFSTSNLLDFGIVDQKLTVQLYYSNFHNIHPFLPPKEVFLQNFNNISYKDDLIFAMKLIIDGQTTSKYANSPNLVSDRVNQCLHLINKSTYDSDLIALQALLLLSLVAHISSLHDLSRYLREKCVKFAVDLELNYIDKEHLQLKPDTNNLNNPNQTWDALSIRNTCSPEIQQKLRIFDSQRLKNIPCEALIDSARRLFWELYMLDICIGSADGKTLSKLASLPIYVNYPNLPTPDQFDYKGRSEATKLVNDVIRMNIAIIEQKPFNSYLIQATAALGNWEMRLEDPTLFQSPYLINEFGEINEGVHQAIIMFHYANIFLHRPFSYLWKTEVPKIPRCTNLDSSDSMVYPDKIASRKIIETRKTIDAANSIVKLLIDTNASKINKRTPLFACSLASASLVHLSAYIWVGSILDGAQNRSANPILNFDRSELKLYGEYIKLELIGIYSISKHWHLSWKLALHIRDCIKKLTPILYETLKESLPSSLVQNSLKSVPLASSSVTASTNQNSLFSTNNSNSDSFDNNSDHSRTNKDSVQSNSNTNSNTNSNNFEGNINEFMDNSIFNIETINNFEPLSPISETGCDWIDKNIFDHSELNFEFDL
ncbi:Zn(II)2Cys6 transcription factor ASCRUDRAFT_37255 [Ascoidea rubescens DSM 1968]|uniref:Zn(2)-C6 fungal-type domain-containing protein n=1 Tax=Ascoidea rubescens DSM 1968 TaxID=1344418 RepID=A0A1D2VDH7_9ASCO|nr:hypothetical protein ASCRUDRAFT_37255 [Ascoidea rubescens DSM 1968]ODV59543.1 hypothetical protein ASCRUDRAFT_37255 [Ascoidea rubescens DSM 1968]